MRHSIKSLAPVGKDSHNRGMNLTEALRESCQNLGYTPEQIKAWTRPRRDRSGSENVDVEVYFRMKGHYPTGYDFDGHPHTF